MPLSNASSYLTRLFVCSVLAVGCTASWAAPTRLGDLNGDGISNVNDLQIIRSHVNGTQPLNAADAVFADLNKDGAVNESDIEELTKEILGTRTPEQLPLATVQLASPSSGEVDVAVTRETILHFSIPLHPSTAMDTTRFYAEFGGRKILSRVEIASDRKKATLFYLEPLPSNARLRVTLDGTGLTDLLGRGIDLDADTVAGGVFQMTFDTLSITGFSATAVIGRVLASETNGEGQNVPIAGVTVTVDGAEQDLRAVTDANGNFTLSPCPAGTFFVHIDGRTSAASSWPNGSYYPFVGKKWHAIAGKLDNKAGDLDDSPTGATGIIYLPLVAAGSLQSVSSVGDTTIEFPASVIAANPALAGTRITVPANSLFADDGTRGGKVGIAPVPADRLPGPLPQGLEPPFVITIQSDGASNFDRPVPLCLPNIERLPAGTKRYLGSFDHDIGEWVVTGAMTVSEDGRFLNTDAGVGVTQPGWHGFFDAFIGTGGGAKGTNCREARRNCFYASTATVYVCASVPITSGLTALPCVGVSIVQLDICYMAEQVKCKDYNPSKNNLGSASKRESTAKADSTDFLWEMLQSVSQINREIFEIASLAANKKLTDFELARFRQLEADRDAQLGLPYAEFLKNGVEILAEEKIPIDNQTKIQTPLFFALIVDGEVATRGRTNSDGSYRVFVPRSAKSAVVLICDPVDSMVGLSTWINQDSGSRSTKFTSYSLDNNPALPDADSDNLPNVSEIVFGTNPNVGDTDNDGINDGTEVQQGTDPLGGYVAITGVIANAPAPAPALELDINNQLVSVAEGAAGIAIYDARAASNPTLIAQIDTPGFANAVASEGRYLAVADDSGGLAIVDLADTSNLRINRQVRFTSDVNAVAVRGFSAFVGLENGSVAEVDLPTGAILSTLTGSARIEDITTTETAVYATTRGTLRIFSSTQPGNLTFVKSVSTGGTTSGFAWRLFSGGGLLYVTQGRGYNLFDLTDPLNPAFLRRFDDTQFGWKQIVTTGTGIGVAAVGNNSGLTGLHDVNLYDLGADGRSTSFVTKFTIDGIARAVGINNGIAYVAVQKPDGTGALQVLNYRSADIARVAPTGSLTTTAPDNMGVEGSTIYLKATVSDDVQVRTVEFSANGQLIGSDGNFPFAINYTLPEATGEPITITAIARDTGGASFTLNSLQIQVAPDTGLPTVAIGGNLSTQLFAQGSDVLLDLALTDNSGLLGLQVTFTLDGAPITAILQPSGQWLVRAPAPGDHTLTAQVTDARGNVGNAATATFRIRQMVVSREVSAFGQSREFGQRPEAVSREISVQRQ